LRKSEPLSVLSELYEFNVNRWLSQICKTSVFWHPLTHHAMWFELPVRFDTARTPPWALPPPEASMQQSSTKGTAVVSCPVGGRDQFSTAI
jgi:hypothetical protein